MNLKQVIAGAAIGCTLGMTGIGLSTGVADAAPPCNPAPGVQCGPGGPGGPPPQRGPGGPPQGDRGPGGPPPGDFHDRGGPGGPSGPPPGDFHHPDGPDFRGPDNHDWRPPWNPGDNDWRGRFHNAPWGMTCRRGAGARRHRLRGTDRYRTRGVRRRHRSTTGASRSSRGGTPGSTNGGSGSSGSGFHSPSDPKRGRPPRSHRWPSPRQFISASTGSAGA